MNRQPGTGQTLFARLVTGLLPLLAGCDYGQAVAQNLKWGTPGLLSGSLTGSVEWLVGALVNAALLGVQ